MKSHSTFSHQMITTSLKKSVRNALAKMATKRDRSFTRSIYGRADVRSELILVEQLESRVLLSGSDFGDAPDSYGTTLANDGPRHGNAKLSWAQLGIDIDGEASQDYSGRSVSLSADGQTVAIGAYQNDGNGSNSGHVRIYQFTSGSWQQLGADIDGEATYDNSGSSVSLSADGQTVAIGAYQNDGNGSNSGHVRIYQFNGSSWVQLGTDIDGEVSGDGSGRSVSLSADGQTVAIGAYLNDGNGTESGHVRIYQLTSGSWQQLGADIDGEANDDYSGRSVSLSADGQTVAIGAYRNAGNGTDSGHVRIYKFSSGSWLQMGADIDGEASGDESGRSVSLSADGQTVAIGANYNDGNGPNSGHVRIYQFTNGSWQQLGADIDGEVSGDNSGRSVSLSADGQTVAIGAYLNDGNGPSSGHVRIYQFTSGSWQQLGRDIDGEASGDYSGTSVSLSADGQTVAIGADFNDGNGTDSGHVRIYQLTELLLGATKDLETDGLPTAAADGDDLNGLDDDDGIVMPTELYPELSSKFEVTTNGPGTLAWWIDFDSSGTFDASERFEQAIAAAGTYSLSFVVPGNVVAGDTYARFRFASNAADVALPTGVAADGEVEDYLVSVIRRDDFGDAPDSYGTTLANDGAWHGYSPFWEKLSFDIDGEASGDNSGWSVSLSADGKTAAVGAPYNDGNGTDSGHVRVYQLTNGRWKQLGADIDGEAENDNSGSSVSISADGQTVAIGAYGNDHNGTYSGHVRIYQYNGSSWVQLGADIDGEAEYDNLGYSVSISADGQTVAIGAVGDDGNGSRSGNVRIYQYNGSSWVQLGADIDGEAEYDYSGRSVSLSADGQTVAIGANDNDGNGSSSGHVRIYQYNGSSWLQLGADIDGEAEYDDSGYSVSISADGQTVAIGAYLNDGNGSNSGHVRIYQYNGSSWHQLGTDIDGEASGDYSGYSVSLSADGQTVAIGAYRNSISGHVRIYQYNGSSWLQLGTDIDGEAIGDQSGWSVSLSADGQTVAIGARYNDGNGTYSGHVRIYQLKNLFLGETKDFEVDGQPTPTAEGDDETNSDDEDGVIFTSSLIAGEPASIDVTTSDSGWLAWWFDFDGSGTFDSNERFAQSITAGTHSLNFGVPQTAVEGDTYARFRFATSSAEVAFPTGPASDGEVEDYLVKVIRKYDYGDAPDSYGTTLDSGGPRHEISLWQQIGLDIDGEAIGDYSGTSVSLSADGQTLAIGANRNDGNGADSGHVRIYQLINGTWQQLGADIDGEASGDYSGTSVSLSADGLTVAIGAYRNDGNGYSSGHVRIFQFIGGSWQQLGADIDGEASGDYSGTSVSLSADGQTVAIGAYGNDGNGSNSGHVRIYQFDGASWQQLGADIDGEATGDYSGYSVSLSADGLTVAIGAYRNDGNGTDSGHVRIYQLINNNWHQLGADIDGEATGDYSGYSVSLSADGQTVAIGAYRNDGNGPSAGHVRVYQLSEVLLGAIKDVETDGQPTDAANGDDDNASDDDGIVFTSPLIEGQQATIDVITTGTGTLAWWVDFDSSGTFDASERFEATILSSGTHSLTFDVPETAVAGNTYARFRFASQADDVSLPTGKASNGEVEDYAILLSPSTNVVTNLLDSGHGSLRQAVLYANHAPSLSNIIIDSALSGGVIQIDEPLEVTAPMQLQGSSTTTLTINTSQNTPLLDIRLPESGTVTLSNLTLQNESQNPNIINGLIHSFNANLTLSNITFTGGSSVAIVSHEGELILNQVELASHYIKRSQTINAFMPPLFQSNAFTIPAIAPTETDQQITLSSGDINIDDRMYSYQVLVESRPPIDDRYDVEATLLTAVNSSPESDVSSKTSARWLPALPQSEQDVPAEMAESLEDIDWNELLFERV